MDVLLQYLQNPIHMVFFTVLLLPSPLDPSSVLPLSDIKETRESVSKGKMVSMIGNRASSTIYQVDEHITLKSVKPWYRSTHSSELYSRLTFEFFYHCVLLTDEGNIYCMLEQHPRLNIVKLIDIDHSEGFYCGNTSHCSTLRSDPGGMQ